MGPVLPAASVARTEKVYAPSPPVSTAAYGDVQAAKAPAVPGPVSLHCVVAPDSAVKVKLTEVLLPGEAGPEADGVSGAVVSRRYVGLVPTGPVLPAASVAWT